MIPDTPFNVVFAEARAARCLSKKQLAERTGFTPGFIQSYEECAKNPTAVTMWKYAMALNLRFRIDRNGISVIDEETEVTMLMRWNPLNPSPPGFNDLGAGI